MELVNIPATVQDYSFRYQRPVAQIKQRPVNGGVTEITNFGLIGHALDRSVKDIGTYIKKKLGCRAKISESNTLELSGLYPCNIIEQHIETFIHEEVLCPRCKNPETIQIIKKKRTSHSCKACGYNY